jgi:hypothetical protein
VDAETLQTIDDTELLSRFAQLHKSSNFQAMNQLELVHAELTRRMREGSSVMSSQREGARFREERMSVRTVWNYVGEVEQVAEAPSGIMQRRVLRTMEAQTRAALLALGWKPPQKV